MIYDVLIVGAGPCGLAVAARLSENTPSALFTDSEHARYWKRFRNVRTVESEHRRAKRSTDSGYASLDDTDGIAGATTKRPSILVLDAHSDQWMDAWNEKFTALNISHLRSPLFFHPDPRDRDGLLAFAYEHGREDCLDEIPNVVGEEFSKHEKKRQTSSVSSQRKIQRYLRVDGRDRIDYFTPETRLFHDYCADIIDRYRLGKLVRKAKVTGIRFEDIGSSSEGNLFCVETNKGLYLSHTVVVTTGNSKSPSIPEDLRLRNPSSAIPSFCHVFSPNGTVLPTHVLSCLESTSPTHIAIVGGGLTSAQVSHLLLTRHMTQHLTIHLILRSSYKIKPFDVSLEWVSKYRNQRMAEFWSADTDEERLSMLQAAKNGGSIPAKFDKIIQKHIASGRLKLYTNTRITSDTTWHQHAQSFQLRTSPAQPALERNPISHVIFATGSTPEFDSIDFLKPLQDEYPIQSLGGFPKLTDELAWSEDVPLFFTGALASLRLGPGAANLAGARQGAERVAWAIEQTLRCQNHVSYPASEEIGMCGGAGNEAGPGKIATTDIDGLHHKSRDRPDSTLLSRLTVSELSDRSEFTGGFNNQFEALQLSPADSDDNGSVSNCSI